MDVTIDPLEPEDRFYRVIKDDLGSGPGQLIRSEELSGDAALKAAGINYRVIYESTSGIGDRLGEPIGVSGIIAFPSTPPPEDGWPVISWAHGTVGSADKCAPSMDSKALGPPGDSGIGLLRKINKAPHKLLNAFLNAGWAVAMTDYEGCGTYGNHPYLLGESEGRGILDIVPVARQFGQPVSDRYAIVGHSQGGQAALFGAHLAYRDDYTRSGSLIAVAALAPASNLGLGLRAAYVSEEPFGDLGAFYPLFSNGVFGGDPGIDKTQIFQDWALEKYLADHDTKARAELSDDPEWMETPPLAQPDPSKGIFRTQVGDIGRITAWAKYWAQVDRFNPAKKITVPIRISQAAGDMRVNAGNTTILVGLLNAFNGHGPITFVEYPNKMAVPDPEKLGDHFGLLIDDTEINDLVGWLRTRLITR